MIVQAHAYSPGLSSSQRRHSSFFFSLAQNTMQPSKTALLFSPAVILTSHCPHRCYQHNLSGRGLPTALHCNLTLALNDRHNKMIMWARQPSLAYARAIAHVLVIGELWGFPVYFLHIYCIKRSTVAWGVDIFISHLDFVLLGFVFVHMLARKHEVGEKEQQKGNKTKFLVRLSGHFNYCHVLGSPISVVTMTTWAADARPKRWIHPKHLTLPKNVSDRSEIDFCPQGAIWDSTQTQSFSVQFWKVMLSEKEWNNE